MFVFQEYQRAPFGCRAALDSTELEARIREVLSVNQLVHFGRYKGGTTNFAEGKNART